jgi:uncharacterized protein YcfJ
MPITSTVIASTALAMSAATVTVPVVSSEPIVRNEPVMTQEYVCTQTQRPTHDPNGALVGGIIGGVIGSQMGHDSSSRRVMTGIGAVIGSQVGGSGPSVPTSHCGTTYVNRAVPTVVGYRVTYIVDGMHQTATMSYNPGSHVTIQRSYSVR